MARAAGRRDARGGRRPLSARTADKHALYQIAVQCPEADVAFLDRVFRQRHGRPPLSLMEDFCGTAYLCRTWVDSRRDRTAVGVDVDAAVLDWALEHNLAPLLERSSRVTLLQRSVTEVRAPRVDVRVGFNFSYSLFTMRHDLLAYFRAARAALAPGGLFVIDLHGGPEAQQEVQETKRFPGFRYTWQQGPMNPVDHRMDCFIHFEFPDGTRIRKAFVYQWRLWGLTELREVMEDAGFEHTEVYWEGTDRTTWKGNGVFRRATRAVNDPSWIAYVVGVR